MSEKQFQGMVVKLARLMGWRVFHPFDSRRSTPGWPDLVLLRGPDLLVRELKTDTGKLTEPQVDWLGAFQAAGVDARVWRPRDWDEVEATLARE